MEVGRGGEGLHLLVQAGSLRLDFQTDDLCENAGLGQFTPARQCPGNDLLSIRLSGRLGQMAGRHVQGIVGSHADGFLQCSHGTFYSLRRLDTPCLGQTEVDRGAIDIGGRCIGGTCIYCLLGGFLNGTEPVNDALHNALLVAGVQNREVGSGYCVGHLTLGLVQTGAGGGHAEICLLAAYGNRMVHKGSQAQRIDGFLSICRRGQTGTLGYKFGMPLESQSETL